MQTRWKKNWGEARIPTNAALPSVLGAEVGMPSFGDPRSVKRASRADQIHQAVAGRNAVVLMILRYLRGKVRIIIISPAAAWWTQMCIHVGFGGFVSGGLGCARRGGWLSDWIPQSDGREQ